MDPLSFVKEIVSQAGAFGCRELVSGARLFGHVPHVAPEAWLHEIYAPLSDDEIATLERQVDQVFPDSLRNFFRTANGLGLFSGSLSIYGKRTGYGRTGDEAWQPFCIVTANTLDRPAKAKPWQLIVGGYRDDGSLMSLDTRDGTAFRTKGRSGKILNRWPDLWTMLTNETSRLAELFDATGHKISDTATTPPTDLSLS